MPAFGYYGNGGSLIVLGVTLLFSGIMVWVTFAQMNQDYNTVQAKNWMLVGGLTPTTATLRVRNDPNTATQQLTIATSSSLADPVQTISITPDINGKLVQAIKLQGLLPKTQYYYRLATPGGYQVFQTGKFRTPANVGTRFNFKVVAAGDAWTGSNNLKVYNEMANEDPDLFLHLGDIHYKDITSEVLSDRIQAVDLVLGSSSQRAVYTTGGLVYVWDDHDFMGNDSGGTTGTQQARNVAMQSYQLAFPSYPLALDGRDSVPIYHAFTYGTVRFIISDLRSEATQTNIYSTGQKQWLYNELSKANQYDFVVWVTSRPWIQAARAGADSWAGFEADRIELSSYISAIVGAQNGPQNLIALSADDHMVAMDDGTNTFYGTADKMANFSGVRTTYAMSFPLLVSAPLDRLGSAGSGPYTEGCSTTLYKRNHQYSVLQFSNSTAPCIDITTYRVDSSKQQIFHRQLCGKFFKPARADVKTGSCSAYSYDTSDVVLLSFSVVLFVLLFLVACWQMWCFMSTILMILTALGYLFIIGLGVGIPWLSGVKQFNLFPAMITAFFFIFTVSIGLGLLMFLRWRKYKAEDDEFKDQLRRSKTRFWRRKEAAASNEETEEIRRQAEENRRQAEENRRQAEENRRKAEDLRKEGSRRLDSRDRDIEDPDDSSAREQWREDDSYSRASSRKSTRREVDDDNRSSSRQSSRRKDDDDYSKGSSRRDSSRRKDDDDYSKGSSRKNSSRRKDDDDNSKSSKKGSSRRTSDDDSSKSSSRKGSKADYSKGSLLKGSRKSGDSDYYEGSSQPGSRY